MQENLLGYLVDRRDISFPFIFQSEILRAFAQERKSQVVAVTQLEVNLISCGSKSMSHRELGSFTRVSESCS